MVIGQNHQQTLGCFSNRTPTSLVLLHTTYTCAFKPVCLLSHNWLYTPDCKALKGMNWCRGQGEALNIDRRDLYARLYACIPELALLPLQPDDGSLDDLLSQGKALLPHTSQMSSVDIVNDASNKKCAVK